MPLSDVLAPKTGLDPADMALMHAVVQRDSGLRSCVSEDVPDLLGGQSAPSTVQVVFPSALLYAISVVIEFCAEAKMVWIHAGRVVACVHDYLPGSDLAQLPLVHEAMGADLNLSRKKKNSVAVSVSRSLPFPTTVRHLFVASIENIVNAKDGKIFEPLCSLYFLVMRAAKFPSDRWRTTENALAPKLVGHQILDSEIALCHP